MTDLTPTWRPATNGQHVGRYFVAREFIAAWRQGRPCSTEVHLSKDGRLVLFKTKEAAEARAAALNAEAA